MIRLLDIALSIVGLFFSAPLCAFILIVCFVETGSPIFVQTRVGRNRRPFSLVKFRTMQMGSPNTASHLISTTNVTRFGRVLRKLKLDEIPQLINVISGDMSLVGPRPCLPEQRALIDKRMRLGVYDYKPGITGYGQLLKVDMSEPERLAQIDAQMMSRMSLRVYLGLICLTLLGKGGGDAVR